MCEDTESTLIKLQVKQAVEYTNEGELRSPEAVREKCDFVSHQRRHDIITQTRAHGHTHTHARTHSGCILSEDFQVTVRWMQP